MLLRFKFSNYRSFRAEQELSLVAGPLSDHSEAVFEIPGLKERVLPLAALYGANASGKTNVLRALQFVQRAIQQSHRLWKPDQAIPLDPFAGCLPETPTRFVVDFVHNGFRHQYGFSANSSRVLEEWLQVYPKGKKQTWFNRRTEGPMSFSDKLTGENRVIEQLTRSNSLFLSAAAQNNHEMLLPIYNWFSSTLTVAVTARAMESQRTMQMCGDPATRSRIGRLLSIADLGITDILVEAVPDEVGQTVDKFFDGNAR